MPELSDVSNDFIRGEIEEFVTRPDEIERMIRPLRGRLACAPGYRSGADRRRRRHGRRADAGSARRRVSPRST